MSARDELRQRSWIKHYSSYRKLNDAPAFFADRGIKWASSVSWTPHLTKDFVFLQQLVPSFQVKALQHKHLQGVQTRTADTDVSLFLKLVEDIMQNS